MYVQIIINLLLLNLVGRIICSSSPQGREVSEWARAIGEELWQLGKEVTLFDEIKQRYSHMKAKVGEKDPQALLAEVKENISRMIDRKTDAIKCIQQEAEKVAENFEYNGSVSYQYYSSKWSSIEGEPAMKVPQSLLKNKYMYLPLKLNNDTHFYNLAVNTSHSSVHVPTNVYDKEHGAAFAIQWSEALDKVFIQNYNSDPALSWQYFGSSSGIMRHYPAKRWENFKKDLFDCRIRTWFIEAATCTKDAIILMDNSGSMKGMGHHIGSLTASSILDTFSNNDYINVLNYSSTTNYSIPCFKEKLVQATRENIEAFKKAIELMQPEGKTDIALALKVSFDLLKEYRKLRGCTENRTNCNQAIMIITDGVNSNLSDIVLNNNYYNNGSSIPVRIFTYLVGKEVQNVEEIKWISCANRGYYTPVQTLEQVTVSVLQYISVIARPLVLQAENGGEHPVSWTHAYVDMTYDDKNDNQINEPYRLLTSAAIPCYDTKINKMNDTRTAYLLGVAGTDVPIDEFNKMTLPYKIGVNGYSFIVSNNGYVLMHPDLRPVFEGILKDNYNSIDLTQVEQHNDGLAARTIGETLKNLRQALVDGKEGSLHNISLSYHYDDMKRISEEHYDYYYAPLDETPFTIGLAFPHKYGNYSLEVDDEIQRNRYTGENLTSFFDGKWKIHPKWVYCKYHYLEGHEFDTPEQELLHFLGKMYDGNFTWQRQYEESKNDNREEVSCGRNTLKDDDYYCDKQLVQRLLFDARNTFTSYNKKFEFKVDNSSLIFFKPSLRFVATMSGLTRWEYILDNPTPNSTDSKSEKMDQPKLNSTDSKSEKLDQPKLNSTDSKFEKTDQHKLNSTDSKSEETDQSKPNSTDSKSEKTNQPKPNSTDSKSEKKEFGDLHPRAINEKWYKNAVLQHQYQKDSFVYSVPFDCGLTDADPLVTGTYAIFPLHNGLEAPGSVVGFQFSQSQLKKMVRDKSTRLTNQCEDCGKCDTTLTCYVVDSSGYIIVSLDSNETGKFFGEVEGDILHSMLNQKIFKKITVFDYQALCKKNTDGASGGSELFTSFKYVDWFLRWLFVKIVYFFVEINIYNILEQVTVYAQDDSNDTNSVLQDQDLEVSQTSNKDDYYACEKKIELFILQKDMFTTHFTREINMPPRRNYYVKIIPNSNLIFVAINNTIRKPRLPFYYTTAPKQITVQPIFELHEMNTLLPCQKLDLNNLPRRHLKGCYNEHPLEHEIVDCGRAGNISLNLLLFLFAISIKFYI